MLKLDLGKPHGETHRILCLGAHSDDIEIGAGGAVLTLLETLPNAHIDWVVLSATPTRVSEAHASAAEFLATAASKDVLLGGLGGGPAGQVRPEAPLRAACGHLAGR